MEQEGGLVGPREPGIVSAARKQKKPIKHIEDNRLNIFLDIIYTFKSDSWPNFLNTLKSQDPQVITQYTIFLSQIYNCIISNEQCNSIMNRYYKNNTDIVQQFVNNMRKYQTSNIIPKQTFQYYLKQNLLVCQFVYNLNAEKQCTEQTTKK